MNVRVFLVFILNIFFHENSLCNVKLDSLTNHNLIKSIIFKNIDQNYQFPISRIDHYRWLYFTPFIDSDNLGLSCQKTTRAICTMFLASQRYSKIWYASSCRLHCLFFSSFNKRWCARNGNQF